MEIKYPCKECDGVALAVLPEAPHVAECLKCGHPNDTPSKRRLRDHDIYTQTERPVFGVVIFYDLVRLDGGGRGIVEIGRTFDLPYYSALNVYAETPNPASQILLFRDEAERAEVLADHAADIINPDWIEDLYNSI